MASRQLTYENATKTLQFIRNFLTGKRIKIGVRHALSQSIRDVPAPNLPVGSAHRLADNYYYTRDGRRAANPPEKISTVKSIESGESAVDSTHISSLTPGNVYVPRP